MLLRLIVGGQTSLENEYPDDTEDLVRSKVLSVAQDLVYIVSSGRKWTPKHVGLSSTLYQATRSKDLVRLFNKAGHCLSYEQVLQMDTSLAESTLKSLDLTTRAIIPPNFQAKKFMHYTCDNIDILDETLDGKNTFHATQMAAWQKSQAPDKSFKNLQPSVKRTLSVPSALEELHPARITPGICTPVFTAPVHKTSVVNPEENNENALQAEATDLAFYLHRQDKELKPSWTIFNQFLSSDESEQTAVGCLPIILAPAHDFDTLNTAVKRCMAISSHFGQEYTVLTRAETKALIGGGGGCIFIYSRSARRISFEINGNDT